VSEEYDVENGDEDDKIYDDLDSELIEKSEDKNDSEDKE